MEIEIPVWERFVKQPMNRIRNYNARESFGNGYHVATVPEARNKDIRTKREDAHGVTVATGATLSIGADFDLQAPHEQYIVDESKTKLLTSRGIFWLSRLNRWLPRVGFYIDYNFMPHRLAHPPKRSKYGWSWDA